MTWENWCYSKYSNNEWYVDFPIFGSIMIRSYSTGRYIMGAAYMGYINNNANYTTNRVIAEPE